MKKTTDKKIVDMLEQKAWLRTGVSERELGWNEAVMAIQKMAEQIKRESAT